MLLELDQLVAQEFFGGVAGLAVHLDPAIDVGCGMGIGDTRGELRVSRTIVDLDQAGAGDRPDAQAANVGIYLIVGDVVQP